MKVALVQDWLTEIGGAEKVFQAIHKLYPEADIYTLVYNKDVLDKLNIQESKTTASFIQKLPFGRKKYRNYLPFFSRAIESFDLSSYDLIISSSYSVAKGVLTHGNQIHICYCHSPVRYAWDLYHQYLKESNLQKGIKAKIVKHFLYKLRIWDVISTNRVDHFISNSNFIKKRIFKVYRRESETIYPPTIIDNFPFETKKADYYITCSRLVPYKKIDLIIETFKRFPDLQLKVIGDGPDMEKLRKLAPNNVQLMGFQKDKVLKKEISKAKAFIFAAEEDFGIVPIEAQACGTPVIAFGKGGSLETVIENVTGVYFKEQTVDSLSKAIKEFDLIQFNPNTIREHALKFDIKEFNLRFSKFVTDILN